MLLKSRGLLDGRGWLPLLQTGYKCCVTEKPVCVLTAPSCPLLRAKDSSCHFKALLISTPAKYCNSRGMVAWNWALAKHQESKLACLPLEAFSFHATEATLPAVTAVGSPQLPQICSTLHRQALEVSRSPSLAQTQSSEIFLLVCFCLKVPTKSSNLVI